MDTNGIGRREEAGLPRFKSHEEARTFFEERFGERFVFEEATDEAGSRCFFYRLITDKEAYIRGAEELNSTGYVGKEFLDSYQPVRIMENGGLQVIHREE
ncbi:hypothetical protein [Indiicoccus explosivorum]|uniref:hypothetical protein n=1 Tax=Indiicoccus explosivorum TaxID=1917864 RepID=UPI000B434345|nr:hypothetical protein [Indiicoccus explosivorum]